MADRIQARAIARAGAILKQIEAQSQKNLKQYREVGDRPSVTRTQAARDAGLSERQRKTALRVANIPEGHLMPSVKTLLYERYPPNPDRCSICGTREGLQIEERPTGENFTLQAWPLCGNCRAELARQPAMDLKEIGGLYQTFIRFLLTVNHE